MRDVKEKVAYLRGLTQGINLNEHSAEGKLLINIVDVLDSLAEEVHDINVAHLDLETYIETIDEDLANLEEEIYDESDSTATERKIQSLTQEIALASLTCIPVCDRGQKPEK